MENITKKEALIGLLAALVILAFAIALNPWAMSFIQRDIREKQRALQIDNSPEQFVYARDTRVGNVMAYGRLSATTPQSIPELTGKFSVVEKVTEEYTMHIEMVCDGYDKDGNCTGYHEETSYSWDVIKRQSWSSPEYLFLGVTFQAGLLQVPSLFSVPLDDGSVSAAFLGRVQSNRIYENDSFWEDVGDLRYRYNALPLEYNATIYTGFFIEDLSITSVYFDQRPADVLESLKRRETFFSIAYYALILLIAEGIYLWIAYELIEVE